MWTHIVIYIVAFFGLLMTIFFILSYFPVKSEDPKPKRFPFVSVILPAYNEEEHIIKSIKSVLQLDYPKSKYEIIVVDDGSTDKTFERAKKFAEGYSNIRVFHKPNGGTASAKNYGIERAKGELITTLDADSFVSPQALKHMVGYFDEPKVSGVTAALNVYKPRGFLQALQWAEYMAGIFLRKTFSRIDAVHVIPGPFSLYKKSFFDRYGGFADNITEDTEIAMRMQTHGYKIRNSMAAAVYTTLPRGLRALFIQRIRWYYGFVRNSIDYKRLFNVRKYGDLAMIILPSAFISVALAIAAVSVFCNSIFLSAQGGVERFRALGFAAFESLFKIKGEYIRESFITYFTNPFIFFIAVGLAISLLWFVLAIKGAKEKRNMVPAFIYFFITYGIFFAAWWLATFIYRGILRKKIRWGPRYY
jgi:cellulose synthase/poly-beta-1,6-N-acetylglucosamine synthase-like glycosyltransferase